MSSLLTDQGLIRQPQRERLFRLKLAERYYIIAPLPFRLAGCRGKERKMGEAFGDGFPLKFTPHSVQGGKGGEFPARLA